MPLPMSAMSTLFVPSSGAGSSPEWRSCGSTFVGFYVISLEATLKSLRALGSKLLVDHQVRPWACRAIVEDPDGRAVEINQRDHCTEAAAL
jgi:hypothetical protein